MHPEALDLFKDSYMVEFLELPGDHSETSCSSTVASTVSAPSS